MRKTYLLLLLTKRPDSKTAMRSLGRVGLSCSLLCIVEESKLVGSQETSNLLIPPTPYDFNLQFMKLKSKISLDFYLYWKAKIIRRHLFFFNNIKSTRHKDTRVMYAINWDQDYYREELLCTTLLRLIWSRTHIYKQHNFQTITRKNSYALPY